MNNPLQSDDELRDRKLKKLKACGLTSRTHISSSRLFSLAIDRFDNRCPDQKYGTDEKE